MADRQSYDLRAEMVDALMEKVETDPYPSNDDARLDRGDAHSR